MSPILLLWNGHLIHRGRKKLKQVINNNNQKASIGRAAQQQCYELKLLLGTRSRNRLMSVRLSLLFSLGFPVPFWLEDRVGEDLVGEGAGEEDADNESTTHDSLHRN